MEKKEFRIQVKVRAELVYSKVINVIDREYAEDVADYVLEHELFENWEYEIFETGDTDCRIYETN